MKYINFTKSNNKKTRSLLTKGSVGTDEAHGTYCKAPERTYGTGMQVPAVATIQGETIYGTGAVQSSNKQTTKTSLNYSIGTK
jgi:hypothetical protein